MTTFNAASLTTKSSQLHSCCRCFDKSVKCGFIRSLQEPRCSIGYHSGCRATLPKQGQMEIEYGMPRPVMLGKPSGISGELGIR